MVFSFRHLSSLKLARVLVLPVLPILQIHQDSLIIQASQQYKLQANEAPSSTSTCVFDGSSPACKRYRFSNPCSSGEIAHIKKSGIQEKTRKATLCVVYSIFITLGSL